MYNLLNSSFMKKILLFVATALFAISGTAQNAQLLNRTRITSIENQNVSNITGRIAPVKAQNAAQGLQKNSMKAPSAKAAPSGEARDYFFYRAENAYAIADLPRINKVTLYFDGNTVYIPNDFYLSQLNEAEPAYLTGTLSDDGSTITIPSHQEIGTVTTYYGDMTLYFSKGELTSTTQGYTLAESEEPIILYVDASDGTIFDGSTSDMPCYVGLFSDSGFYGYAYNMLIFPSSNFEKSERTLTGIGEVPDHDLMQYVNVEVNKTVEEYNNQELGLRVFKGLFDYYPNAYVMAFNNEDGSLSVGAQVVADDYAMVATDNIESGEVYFDFASTFTAGAYGSYTQLANETLFDLYSDGSGLYGNAYYSNLKLGAPVSSGISNTVTNDVKDAVSTQSFDLSGRRINGAEKGVNIKVMKFADGTSKAVKVMK